MNELENQGLTDTQVDIEFLPNKSFLNQMIRITVRNWDNGRNASYTIRREELEYWTYRTEFDHTKLTMDDGLECYIVEESRAMDILNYLLKEVNQ